MCSKCKAAHAPVVLFTAIAGGYFSELDPVCVDCLGGTLGGLEIEADMEELSPGRAPRRKALRKQQKLSQKQEFELAEQLGGRTQPGSGNQRGSKGDVRKKGEMRLEAKFTFANSFSLHLDDLEKIDGECTFGEKPVFVIDYKEQGTAALRGRFVVVPFSDYQELKEKKFVK